MMRNYKVLAIVAVALFIGIKPICAVQKTYPARKANKLDVATKVNVGGYWADSWDRKVAIVTNFSDNSCVITLFPQNEQAWNFYCRITLKDFTIPNSKIIKEHKKSQDLYYYACNVEYFYNVQYPSIEECFASYAGFVVTSKDTEAKKRTIEGQIGLNPFFFSAGDKFGDKIEELMDFHLFIDDVAMRVYFMDHLKF